MTPNVTSPLTQREFDLAAARVAAGSITFVRRNKVADGGLFYEALVTVPDDASVAIEALTLTEAEALVEGFVARGARREMDFTVNHCSPH